LQRTVISYSERQNLAADDDFWQRMVKSGGEQGFLAAKPKI
jgi:hypothetical protein